jgi:hypothetical protein
VEFSREVHPPADCSNSGNVADKAGRDNGETAAVAWNMQCCCSIMGCCEVEGSTLRGFLSGSYRDPEVRALAQGKCLSLAEHP